MIDESIRKSMIYGYLLESNNASDNTNNIENNIKELLPKLDIEDKDLLISFLKEVAILLIKLVAEMISNHVHKSNIVVDKKTLTKKVIANQFSIINIRELKPFEDKKNGDTYRAFKFTIKLNKSLINKVQMKSIPMQTVVFKNDKIYDYGKFINYKKQ